MKSKTLKKLLTTVMVVTLAVGSITGCSSNKSEEKTSTDTTKAPATETPAAETPAAQEDTATAIEGGTLMWLSNLSSGLSYEASFNYATMICDELGYKLQVVYGDPFNDPAGNLKAVKNGMTKDVVGLIASQDGGIKDILAEYPDLNVAGYNNDMRSVYGQDATNADVASNPKFLGTMNDGFFDGVKNGEMFAKLVIDNGYKTVSTIIFPAFAYPAQTVADLTFRAEIEKYNGTVSADQQVTVVGEKTKVLEFKPLEESYFLEEGYGDLDAIVGFCAGSQFIYPTMKTAIANGSCSDKTKLLTGGFDNDPALLADIGGEGIIQYNKISPNENIAWAIVMLDNAINGKMYSDFTNSEVIDSLPYIMDSTEDVTNVTTKALTGTADSKLAQITMDDLKKVLTRYNESATYAELKALFQSEQLTVDALASK
jgi:hypothetical protein